MVALSNVRPSIDIEEDIRKFIRSYDPLKQSRPYFDFTVKNGVVVMTGNIGSAVAHRVLNDSIPDIAGVVRVDMSTLYNDDDLRFEIGKLVPPGISVRVNYGVVMLAGRPLESMDGEAIAAKVRAVPGIREVVTRFF